MTKKNCLSLDYLKTLFVLDDNIPHGIRWNKSRTNSIKVGDAAGTLNMSGYYTVKIDLKLYKNHRIIFCLYNNTEMSDIDYIDHIDRNPLNNHPLNLRKATRGENNKNKKRRKDNTSGFTGVGFNKTVGKYWARVQHQGERIYFGYFNTAIEATRARDEHLFKKFPSPFNLRSVIDDN